MKRHLMLFNLRIRHSTKEAKSTLGRAFAPVHFQIHVIATIILVVEAEVTGVAFELWGGMARRLTMLVAGYPPRIKELITVGAIVDHTEDYFGFLLSGLGEFRGLRNYLNRN